MDNIKYYNVCEKPIRVYGLIKPDEKDNYFKRVPQNIAQATDNLGVISLSKDTAGGRAAFKTNSKFIAIKTVMHYIQLGEHFPPTSTAGFDLYEKSEGKIRFVNTFTPPYTKRTEAECECEYESVIELDEPGDKEYIINFPLYSGVKRLYVGIEDTAALNAPDGFAIAGAIVYYGSSITQGGCASRPGNSYESMISRQLDCDYINLGFSGSAMGETVMAEYIAGLDMSVFVYDYDYNAPTVEHLKKTHKPFFDIIRKANPELPVIMLTRPEVQKKGMVDERYAVVEETYKTAIAEGDKNVYLIDGREIMKGIAEDSGTVDSVHPNDLGFYCMAQRIGEVLKRIIK